MVAQTLVLVLTIVLTGATAFLYGSFQALFAAVIAAMIYFAFIGVTAVVHGVRRGQLGEGTATKTLLVVCGILTTLVFAYITIQFLSAPTIWGKAASVGGVPGYLVAYGYVLGSCILGAVIYLASKSYNAKKGIDLSLAFKEIPPE